MPIQRKSDSKGPYYQYGNSGAKYHYKAGNEASRKKAKKRAQKQSNAIHASGYREQEHK